MTLPNTTTQLDEGAPLLPSTTRRSARLNASQKATILWTVVVMTIFLAAVLAPQIAPRDPLSVVTRVRLKPPGSVFPDGQTALLGTDQVGRDILSRILYGARISLFVGFASVVLAGLVGVTLGLISGYFGRAPDMIIMRLADIQLAFPSILLAIALTAALGPGLGNLIIALGLSRWVVYARLVRSSVLSLRSQEFVVAAEMIGGRDSRIILRHILPNVITPIIIATSIEFGRMIIAESALSFLGLGIQPPTPTWGSMIADGRNYLYNAWWVSTIPGIALSVAVLAVGLMGDSLRDMLDPRFRSYD